MTHEERVVVSAYTGYLMTDFHDVHEYIEKKLGRPIWTHQLADDAIWAEIRKATREDFQRLCEVVVEQ